MTLPPNKKPCARCGCVLSYYTLDMEPKPAPPEDVLCAVCLGRGTRLVYRTPSTPEGGETP